MVRTISNCFEHFRAVSDGSERTCGSDIHLLLLLLLHEVVAFGTRRVIVMMMMMDSGRHQVMVLIVVIRYRRYAGGRMRMLNGINRSATIAVDAVLTLVELVFVLLRIEQRRHRRIIVPENILLQ